ncbi:MAG: monovalent cation/H(+) antiporter subunit G [Candidatus Binatia bacterium]|jgi:multicomponent Na+:H+ antiporter subunit G|nr:monovalent cation/H(+) antiporter subunit G [Candidatus Binatia bacterium]
MDRLLDILILVFLAGGSFFAFTGAVGILKMPDFYSRLHPAGKSDTLAQMLIIAGLLVHVFYSDSFDFRVGIKLFVIVVILFITSPTATHAITKAAHVDGLKPWRKEGKSNV